MLNILLLLKLLTHKFAVLDAGGTIYVSPIIEDENDLYDPHYCVSFNQLIISFIWLCLFYLNHT